LTDINLLKYITSFIDGKRLCELTNGDYWADKCNLYVLQNAPNLRFTNDVGGWLTHNKQLDTIKWLIDNVKEMNTRCNLELACLFGDNNIVKWLHYNRDDECCTSAINNAIANGRLNLIKWLFNNRINYFPDAISTAIHHNRTNIIKWLRKHKSNISNQNGQLDT
jgi:hypothetical protein